MKRYYAPGFAPIPSQNGVVSVRSVGGFGEPIVVTGSDRRGSASVDVTGADLRYPVPIDSVAEGLSPVALEMFNAQYPTFDASGFGPGGGTGSGSGSGSGSTGTGAGSGLFKCPNGAVVQAAGQADAAVKCAAAPAGDNTKYILIGVAVVAALLLLK